MYSLNNGYSMLLHIQVYLISISPPKLEWDFTVCSSFLLLCADTLETHL